MILILFTVSRGTQSNNWWNTVQKMKLVMTLIFIICISGVFIDGLFISQRFAYKGPGHTFSEDPVRYIYLGLLAFIGIIAGCYKFIFDLEDLDFKKKKKKEKKKS
jgi:hypothetical protein